MAAPRARSVSSVISRTRRHKNVRAQLARAVSMGLARCARCGELIAPGAPWDLGHVDGDPTRYAGPEHRDCNRRAGQATAAANRRRRRRSRVW